MGQAKRRGTFEERYALAKQKQAELLAKQNLALTKQVGVAGIASRKYAELMLVRAALASLGI